MAVFNLPSLPFPNILLIFMLLAMAITAFGQDTERAAEMAQSAMKRTEMLPSRLGSGWQAVTPVRTLGKDEWTILPNADIHAEYGLKNLITRQYIDGQAARHTVEIFEMNYTSGAYGLFSFNRNALPANRKEFFVGRFMVSIAGDQPDPAVISELERLLSNESGPVPFLQTQLPNRNKIDGTEKYLIGPAALALIEPFSHLKEIIDFSGGVQIATAAYNHAGGQMNIMIVEYNTPQSASDGLARALGFYESRPSNEKQSRIVKRTGNYLIEVSGIRNRPEAEELIGQIKYSPRVTWEGSKISDIPWQFRPWDAAAFEEASETAVMLIRTFYWIGILIVISILMGVITGGSFFYWRRYRRRKLGLDDIFSDPGDTVRLNLDDYLIEQGEHGIKQIGPRNE